MSKISLFEAIELLESKIKKGKKHFVYDAGICENLSTIMNKFVHFEVKTYAVTWKKFSGDPTFPISGEKDYLHHKEFESLWVGDQLRLRLALLSHMKVQLQRDNVV